MPALTKGQLVTITGSKALMESPEGWKKADSAPKDMNGEMGQLTEWDESKKVWMVATFGATMLSVSEDYLKPLSSADVEDFDIVLGPASLPDVMGSELTESLSKKGFSLCKLFVAPEDLADIGTAVDKAVEDGAFSRLAGELEPGYLGVEGTGKTLAIDLDSTGTPDMIKGSPINILEEAISTVGMLMRPYTEEELGFDMYSRSNTLLALPFAGDEDQYFHQIWRTRTPQISSP
jgi:hypothetical protein